MNKPTLKYRSQKYIGKIDNEIQNILGDEIFLITKLKEYIVESGGKRVRSILACLLAELYGELEDDIFALAGVVEIIHAASLLHDDVLDNSSTRRGKPSGKEIFGPKEVILGGDYMLACAIRKLNYYENPALMDVFTRVIRDLSISELIQMEYANNPDITLDLYYKIIYGKTASLFQTACEAVAIYTQKSEDEKHTIGEFGKNLGLLFQIRDDYLDYFNNTLLNKPAFQDFENGYYTYPVLVVREQGGAEVSKRIDNLFNSKISNRKDKTVQKEILQVLNEHHAQELSRKKINELFDLIQKQLSGYPESDYKDKITSQIENLMDF
ncbi:MAG: polyprenyl synthetase family protein [Leptospirales bacterium]